MVLVCGPHSNTFDSPFSLEFDSGEIQHAERLSECSADDKDRGEHDLIGVAILPAHTRCSFPVRHQDDLEENQTEKVGLEETQGCRKRVCFLTLVIWWLISIFMLYLCSD